MTNSTYTASAPSPLWQYWRGLSGWNFYFLVKFGLLWAGYLNFHPLLNLVFMAFLLMPLPNIRLHRLRHWIAIPVGFALFWHDTWLPGPDSIMSQGSQVAGFSASYILDLTERFINWQMIGAVFVLLVAWLFLSQWIRVTVFVVAIMIWLNVLTLAGPLLPVACWPADHHGDHHGWQRGSNRYHGRRYACGGRYPNADRTADLHQPERLALQLLYRRRQATDQIPGCAACGCSAV
jgi:hypothetical protein